VALLENPIGTRAENYLTNGNRLLLDLFNVQVEMVDALTDPTAQLDELATRLEAQGFRPTLFLSAARTRWARWGMWKVRWKLRSSARRGEPPPSWWRPAVRARMPGWRWGWNNCCRRSS
jgi:1-aminocyclopropane-1-carboxylate deaminase/D-cysteine desulfhydrase-like pyridoxal-dependent ACC family enzyme